MGVIGGPAGYASIEAQPDYIGQALSGAQEMFSKVRADKAEQERLKVAAKRQEQEDRRREIKDAAEFSDKNPFVATGTGIDAANRQGWENAKNAYADAIAQYQSTGDKKYLAIAENAKSSIAGITNFPTKLNEIMKGWAEKSDDYDPQDLADKAKLLDKFATGELVQQNDANGNPSFIQFEKVDGVLSKVGTPLRPEEVIKMLTPDEKLDWAKQAGEFNKIVGKETTEKTLKGDFEYTRRYTPGAENIAEQKATELISNPAYLRQLKRTMGIDAKDETKNKEVFEYAKKQFMDLAPDTTTESEDYERRKFNSMEKSRAETSRHQKVMENKKSGDDGTDNTPVKTTVYDKPFTVGTENPVNLPVGTKYTTVTRGTKANPKAIGVFATPGGRVYMQATTMIPNEANPYAAPVKSISVLNFDNPNDKAEINDQAVMAGYSGIDDFKASFQQKKKAAPKAVAKEKTKATTKPKEDLRKKYNY